MLQHSYNYTKRYTVIYLVQPRIYRTMIQSCKQSDFSTKAGKKKKSKNPNGINPTCFISWNAGKNPLQLTSG